MGNHLNGNYLLDGPTARGAHASVKPGVESRFIGTEPQVTDQLRTMSPRTRATAVAISEHAIRPLPPTPRAWMVVHDFSRGLRPGLYAVVRFAHCSYPLSHRFPLSRQGRLFDRRQDFLITQAILKVWSRQLLRIDGFD